LNQLNKNQFAVWENGEDVLNAKLTKSLVLLVKLITKLKAT